MARRQIFQLLEMSIMEWHIKAYVPHRMHFKVYDDDFTFRTNLTCSLQNQTEAQRIYSNVIGETLTS